MTHARHASLNSRVYDFAAACAINAINRMVHPIASFFGAGIRWTDVDGYRAINGSLTLLGFATVYKDGVDFKIMAAFTSGGDTFYCLAYGADAGTVSGDVPTWNNRLRFTDGAGFRRARQQMRYDRVHTVAATSPRDIPARCSGCGRLAPAADPA